MIIKIDIEGHEAEVLRSTSKEDWLKTDAMVEVGSESNAEIIFLEGYLWDEGDPRKAFDKAAIEITNIRKIISESENKWLELQILKDEINTT